MLLFFLSPGVSVAILQLLNPADAWLDPDQPLLAPHPAPIPRISAKQQQQQQRRSPNNNGADLPVITFLALQQEAELFAASVALLHCLPGLEIMQYEITAEYLVEQLLGTQQFAAAVRLVHIMWDSQQQQQQLGDKLEAVAYELASSCVRLQVDQESETVGNDPSSSNTGQMLVSYTGPGYLGSSAAAAWHKLRQLLELYDGYDPDNTTNGAAAMAAAAAVTSSTMPSNSSSSKRRSISALGGRMRVAAVDGALSTHPGLHLPAWFIQPFQPVAGISGGMAGSGLDPAALLRVYMKHGRLIDGAELLKSHLDAWQRQNPVLRAKPCAVWLPLRDMELLYASLVAGAKRAHLGHRSEEAELLGVWSEVLKRGLADHMALVRSDGDKLGIESDGGDIVGMVY